MPLICSTGLLIYLSFEGVGSDVMFHLSGTNTLHFYNEERYTSDDDVISVEIVDSEKYDADLKLKIAVTPSGIVGCYFCENAEQGVQDSLQDMFATIRTYDIATGQLLKTFDNIKAGLFASECCC